MLLTELDYELPAELIAERPPPTRDGARLLVVGPEGDEHSTFSSWASRVAEGSLVVVNDTRVMRCRLFGQRKGSGGRVELLLLEPLSDDGRVWRALTRANKPLAVGGVLVVDGAEVLITGRDEDGALSLTCSEDWVALMSRAGHVPLPPYMKRADEPLDDERYQTVYARQLGSAAAPTAGLHLTAATLQELAARNVTVAATTLHVGAGTFRPVSAPRVEDHPIHAETFTVTAELAAQIDDARDRGAPVVAVGTTVVRALESAAAPGRRVTPMSGRTRLMITPGYRFQVVDALLTNFHTPRSTLLALVKAFAGGERIDAAYRAAIEHRYRFLSYGDAMWLPQSIR